MNNNLIQLLSDLRLNGDNEQFNKNLDQAMSSNNFVWIDHMKSYILVNYSIIESLVEN